MPSVDPSRASRFPRLVLYGLAMVFGIVGLQALLIPRIFLEPVGIDLLTTSGYAEVRAGYGGLFTGAALLFAWGARREALRPVALTIAVWVLGVFAGARLVSLVVDGLPNPFSLAILGLELTGCTLAVVARHLAVDLTEEALEEHGQSPKDS